MRPFFSAAFAIVIALAATLSPATADDYPTKPIKLIIPYPGGSGGDVSGRILAQEMSKILGRNVFVENRAGALGTIGSGLAVRAPADGYTLLLGNPGTHGAASTMIPNLSYDPIDDFTPISMVNKNLLAVMVNKDLPVNTLAELIAYAKANPGKLSYGTPGVGTPHWLAGETLKKLAGIDVLHVPFQGGAPAMSALLGGHVLVVVGSLSTGVEQYKSGQIKMLGIAEPTRIAEFPEVPAVAELYPGFDFSGWWGLFGPRGLPQPIVERLNAAVRDSLAIPELKSAFEAAGFVPIATTPAGLQDRVRDEIPRWKEFAKAEKP
jgi:tripartite-type tricarboxylate transporter receptor subunit TctC